VAKDKGKDNGGRRDSRRVFGGISGRAGKAPGDRGAGRYSTDQKRPPEKAPRPIIGPPPGGGGNSN
jgi:hypothetical protein